MTALPFLYINFLTWDKKLIPTSHFSKSSILSFIQQMCIIINYVAGMAIQEQMHSLPPQGAYTPGGGR